MIYQLQQPSLSRKEELLLYHRQQVFFNDEHTKGSNESIQSEATTSTTTDTTFDVHKFIQLFAQHLLMDHYDKAYTQLSKRISFQFRDAIQLRIKKIKKPLDDKAEEEDQNKAAQKTTKVPSPVDVQILKRQLKGAVGSFIEDKLPILLLDKYNTTRLQTHLHETILRYCPDAHPPCILDHTDPFLKELEHYTAKECQDTLIQLNDVDLPRLFEKTRAQISGILVHFNQHTMDQNLHTLELRVKKTPATTKKQTTANHHQEEDRLKSDGLIHAIHLPFLQPTDDTMPTTTTTTTALPPTMNRRNWITPEMVHEFITFIHHSDHEDPAGGDAGPSPPSLHYFIDMAL
ncbi:hypothetical protein BDF20DRAFT_826510 [Mycotypha africana]|uniref:uncharacterized protein n=1 Tax=Mycotypha africana TaxID=64632 RepID=UPI0023000A7C|nr:uncharacterized protein BDF20DRAFT_826510 [Mycotypha africana]KAI8970319.1 hypothetical protein BDF20DRAFT_826510 [Mycotypha africana]